MEFSTDYPQADEGAAIVLEYCDDVTISNNKAKGFDRPVTVTRSSDTTTVEIGSNDGFGFGKTAVRH
jgi:hypothetical protein